MFASDHPALSDSHQVGPGPFERGVSYLQCPEGGKRLDRAPFRQSRRLTLKRTVEKPMRGIVEMPMRHTLWAQVPRATTDAPPG